MSKLEQSLERFSKAIDAVEAAMNRKLQRTKAVDALQQEIAALRQDRARLAEELDELKAETRALEGVTDQVASRLDTAIRDIRAVLEN